MTASRRHVTDAFVALAVGAAMLVGAAIGWRNGHGGMPGRGRLEIGAALSSASPWLWFGALACAGAVAARRSWPLVSWLALTLGVMAYTISGGPTPGAVLPAALCAYTLARRVSTRASVAAMVAIALGLWASAWRDPLLGLDDERTWARVVTALAWVVAPALVGLVLSSRRAAAAQRRTDELNRVAAAERLAMARDVHDIVGHSLSLIALQSGIALRLIDTDPAQTRRSLEAIRTASTTSLDELRRTLSVVRSGAALTPTPGIDDIAALVDSVRATGRTVALDNTSPRDLPLAVQLVAHRVVQEALTNAVRYAPGGPIDISLTLAGTELLVRVLNDGDQATIIEGNGLRGMRERVDSIGGRLTVLAREQGGVLVEARLPVGDRDGQ